MVDNTMVYGSPPPAKRRYRQYSPSTMTKAYESVIDGDLSVRKASKVYNIPMQTLRDRVIGHVGPETLRSGPGPLLSELEETRLVDFIKDMARVGYAYTRAEVINIATEFAACLGRRDHDKPLSYKWFYAFLGRWPELKVQRPKSISDLRAKATSRESINNYFKELDKILTKYDLKNSPEAIYNVDEKGVQQNFKPSYVVGTRDCTPSVITSERSSTTTILGCGNALGQQIPPYFVFAGARMRSELLEGGSPGGADGTVSKSGWSNGEVFQQYLENHFLKFAIGKRPLLILYDGHRSHISPYVIDWAIEQNIILYVLPPHTSHILQPMDVGCFGPFAKIYSTECNKFQRSTGRVIDRYSVCSIACKAYTAALSPKNLQSAFSKSGIYPLQPDVVDTDLFETNQLRADLQAVAPDEQDVPVANHSTEPEQPLPDTDDTLPYFDDNEIFIAVPLQQATQDVVIETQNTNSPDTNVNSDENPLIKEFFKKKRPVFQPPFKSERRSISKIIAGKAITEPDVSKQVKEYLNSVPAPKKAKSVAPKSVAPKSVAPKKAKSVAPKSAAPKKAKSVSKGSTRSNGPSFSVPIKVEQPLCPKPSTSGMSKYGGPIDISTPAYHTEDDDDDVSEDDDDEKCCVCDKFQPAELANCVSVVFVKWAKCDFCHHWTHLNYCTSVRVLRRGDLFRCPHCENNES